MLGAIRANAGRDADPFDVADLVAPPMHPDLVDAKIDSKAPRRKSVPGAPHTRYTSHPNSPSGGSPVRGSVFGEDLPGDRRSDGQQSLFFRNCDADQDGLLSRSEFTSAILMICRKYPSGNAWFEAMTIEELDAEFDLATRRTAGEVHVTAEQFEEWLPTFKMGYLRERRLLEQLQVDASATEATVRGLPSADHMAAAVRAIAMRCQQLESLTLRGAVSAESVRLLASSCGERLRCLDLSETTVDDEALGGLSEGCTALRVLRLVHCSSLGAAGIAELAELVKGECKGLGRLVVGEDYGRADAAVGAALAELPATCVVVRAADADAGAAVGEAPMAAPAAEPPPAEPPAEETAEIQVQLVGQEGEKKSGGCCVLQ